MGRVIQRWRRYTGSARSDLGRLEDLSQSAESTNCGDRKSLILNGEMSEWLTEHAWKACVGETLPWVRIPLSPPTFAKRSLRSRLRLAGRDTQASSMVVHRSAEREGGRPPVSESSQTAPPPFAGKLA